MAFFGYFQSVDNLQVTVVVFLPMDLFLRIVAAFEKLHHETLRQ